MNSAGRKLPDPVLFVVDRDAWSRALGEALTAAGIAFVAHYERFAPDAPDTEWLSVAGNQGWVVLTRDQNIRRRPLERAAVLQHKVVMFVLGQGNISAAETARIVVDAHSRMMRKGRGPRRAAIFTLTRTGEIHAIKVK
jgi:predicted nuclease of predicted toxin-antitoxin system